MMLPTFISQNEVVLEGVEYSPIRLWTKSERKKLEEKKNFPRGTLVERSAIYYLLRTAPEYQDKFMSSITKSYGELRTEYEQLRAREKEASKEKAGAGSAGGEESRSSDDPEWWDRAVEAYRLWKGN